MNPDPISQFRLFLNEEDSINRSLKYKLLHDFDSITKKDLTVRGDLYLENTQVTKLPHGLSIQHDLWLQKTPIMELPSNLKVGWDIYLDNTQISFLPPDLRAGGFISLKNTPLSEKYTVEEIKQMVPGVKGNIYI